MDDNKLRFGVGVLVVATIGVAIILTFLFGAFPTMLSREYELLVEFPSAEGVRPDTPVLRDGVQIGRVSHIDLMDENGVLLTLAMESNTKLTHRYYPRIGTGSLITGDAVVEFVRGSDETLRSKLQDNYETLVQKPYLDDERIDYGEKSADPLRMFTDMEDDVLSTLDKIRAAGESIAQAGNNVNELAVRVNEIVGGSESSVDNLSGEAVETLQEFQDAIKDARQVIQDVQAIVGSEAIRTNLESSIAKIPNFLDEAQATLESTQETFKSFNRVGTQFEKVGAAAEQTVLTVQETVESAQDTVKGVQRTVENVERFTKPLGDHSEELVSQVLVSLANLDNALLQINTFGEAVNNSDGTVRRLLEDDDVYWQIRRTLENVEAASARIRPILDDVRVFSDKVARDPRELGVRGAISKRPSGSGLK